MKIETKDYYWDCGDPACCVECGVILYIDGEEVDLSFGDIGDAYRYVLEHLQGCEVNYIQGDVDEENLERDFSCGNCSQQASGYTSNMWKKK